MGLKDRLEVLEARAERPPNPEARARMKALLNELAGARREGRPPSREALDIVEAIRKRRRERGLKGRLDKLRREAEEGAVVIRLRDGTARYFEEMDVLRETFLAQCDLFKGQPPKGSSGVIAAVLGATDRSRADFERRFGVVAGMEVHIVGPDWVEAHTLLEDGSVGRTFRGPEAERARREARGVEDLSD